MKAVNKFFELFGEFMIVVLAGLSIATIVVAGCIKALDDLNKSTEIERLERRVSNLEAQNRKILTQTNNTNK